MNITTTQRDDVKAALIEALKTNGGDTKNETVVAAIKKLASFNPQRSITEQENLLEGNWLLINAPNFPDRLSDYQQRYIYTLGRLAFNMFEPVGLKIEIDWMFGIDRVSDIETQTGRQTFAMNKPPKGKLKLLYLDEELRITKGNRETVLICKRQNNY
jgi:hypothetical protein